MLAMIEMGRKTIKKEDFMKKLIIFVVSIILLLGMVSCTGGDVSKEDTDNFLAQFEDTSAFKDARLGSEDEQTATYAMSDFFGKTGNTKGGLFNLPILNPYNSKVIDGEYGTYEWDSDSMKWVCTDETYPTDGYLYKWTFIDENDNEHDAQFLFDNLSFFEVVYSDDYEEYTDSIPTSMHAALIIDEDTLVTFNYTSEFEGDGDLSQIRHLEATLTFVGHSEIEVEFDGSVYIMQEDSMPTVDMARIRFTDIDDNWWEVYRIEDVEETEESSSATFVYENSEGWNVTVDATNTNVVENEIEYGRTDLDGEITKDGRHAADIEGVLWSPADETHVPYVNVIYPDGTIEPIDMAGVMSGMGSTLGLK